MYLLRHVHVVLVQTLVECGSVGRIVYYLHMDEVTKVNAITSLNNFTKDDIKMVPVVPLFSTEHSKGEILALSQELR